MKATILDLRRNPKKILEAIERNETVSLSKRGKEVALIVPRRQGGSKPSLKETEAFGIWKDRAEMQEPVEYVRELREGRFRDL